MLGVSVDSQYAHLQWSRQPRNEGEGCLAGMEPETQKCCGITIHGGALKEARQSKRHPAMFFKQQPSDGCRTEVKYMQDASCSH